MNSLMPLRFLGYRRYHPSLVVQLRFLQQHFHKHLHLRLDLAVFQQFHELELAAIESLVDHTDLQQSMQSFCPALVCRWSSSQFRNLTTSLEFVQQISLMCQYSSSTVSHLLFWDNLLSKIGRKSHLIKSRWARWAGTSFPLGKAAEQGFGQRVAISSTESACYRDSPRAITILVSPSKERTRFSLLHSFFEINEAAPGDFVAVHQDAGVFLKDGRQLDSESGMLGWVCTLRRLWRMLPSKEIGSEECSQVLNLEADEERDVSGIDSTPESIWQELGCEGTCYGE